MSKTITADDGSVAVIGSGSTSSNSSTSVSVSLTSTNSSYAQLTSLLSRASIPPLLHTWHFYVDRYLSNAPSDQIQLSTASTVQQFHQVYNQIQHKYFTLPSHSSSSSSSSFPSHWPSVGSKFAIRMFHSLVSPSASDALNLNGGKWVLRATPSTDWNGSQVIWFECCVAAVLQQFAASSSAASSATAPTSSSSSSSLNKYLCGVVFVSKPSRNEVQIWVSKHPYPEHLGLLSVTDAVAEEDRRTKVKLAAQQIRSALGVDERVRMDYFPHQTPTPLTNTNPLVMNSSSSEHRRKTSSSSSSSSTSSSSRDKDRRSTRSSHRHRDRDKDRDREKERDRDGNDTHSSSSSSSSRRERSDRDRDHRRHRDSNSTSQRHSRESSDLSARVSHVHSKQSKSSTWPYETEESMFATSTTTSSHGSNTPSSSHISQTQTPSSNRRSLTSHSFSSSSSSAHLGLDLADSSRPTSSASASHSLFASTSVSTPSSGAISNLASSFSSSTSSSSSSSSTSSESVSRSGSIPSLVSATEEVSHSHQERQPNLSRHNTITLDLSRANYTSNPTTPEPPQQSNQQIKRPFYNREASGMEEVRQHDIQSLSGEGREERNSGGTTETGNSILDHNSLMLALQLKSNPLPSNVTSPSASSATSPSTEPLPELPAAIVSSSSILGITPMKPLLNVATNDSELVAQTPERALSNGSVGASTTIYYSNTTPAAQNRHVLHQQQQQQQHQQQPLPLSILTGHSSRYGTGGGNTHLYSMEPLSPSLYEPALPSSAHSYSHSRSITGDSASSSATPPTASTPSHSYIPTPVNSMPPPAASYNRTGSSNNNRLLLRAGSGAASGHSRNGSITNNNSALLEHNRTSPSIFASNNNNNSHYTFLQNSSSNNNISSLGNSNLRLLRSVSPNETNQNKFRTMPDLHITIGHNNTPSSAGVGTGGGGGLNSGGSQKEFGSTTITYSNASTPTSNAALLAASASGSSSLSSNVDLNGPLVSLLGLTGSSATTKARAKLEQHKQQQLQQLHLQQPSSSSSSSSIPTISSLGSILIRSTRL